MSVIARARTASGGNSVSLTTRNGSLQDLIAKIRDQDIVGYKISDGSVILSISDAIRLLETEWIRWSPDTTRFLGNRRQPYSLDDVESSSRLKTCELSDVVPQVQDCRIVDLLDDHQLRNVAVMTIPQSSGACLFDEQGTGKTISVVAAFDILVERDETDTLLVVAPKSMVAEWQAEIRRFTQDIYRVVTLTGSRRDKAALLSTGADVYVCNYETVATMQMELRLLCRNRRVTLVADESFVVKNPDAARTIALSELREWCGRTFVLCGTPTPNDPNDVVSQVSLVDFGRAFGGVVLSPVIESRQEQIRDILGARVVYTRNLKLQVLPNLPLRTFTRVPVPLSGDQQRLYLSLARNLTNELTRATDESFLRDYANFLARRAALLRTCSDPSSIDPTITDPPVKHLVLDELLDRTIRELGHKVVIWSYYRNSLDALAQRYRHYGLVRVDGSVSDISERRAAVHSFQTSDDTTIFLGNPAAAGAGITLHSGTVAIYESMSNQAAHYLQSLDRIHRRGQEQPVEYVALLCEGTIEEVEFQRLQDKADRQSDLLEDPPAPKATRTLWLEELLSSIARVEGT